MSTLAFTFSSESLADTIVDIECGGRVGHRLAKALAGRGARLHLRGGDSASLHALQTAIARQWGRAEPAGAFPAEDASRIRFFTSPESLLAGLAADDRTTGQPDIAILPGDFRREAVDPVLAETAGRGRHLHVILLSGQSDIGSAATDGDQEKEDAGLDPLAGLAIFLLSPTGAHIPSQCFHVVEAATSLPHRMSARLAMPICAPALAN